MSEAGNEGQAPIPEWIKHPLGVLERRWRWMLLVVLVGSAATAGIWLSVPMSYKATATLLIESQQIPDNLVQSTVVQDPYERINALISQMNAREQLAGLIRRRNLYVEERKTMDMADVVEKMRDDIEIVPQTGIGSLVKRRGIASIYAISYSHPDAQVAADVANELASLLANHNKSDRADQARTTTDFLKKELASSKQELDGAEGAITKFKERYRGELPEELTTNLNKLDRLGSERESLTQQIAAAETRLALTTAQAGQESATSPGTRLAELRAQLAAQQAVNTDEHPNVVSLKRQVAALERQIREGNVEDSYDPARRVLVASSKRSIDDLRSALANASREIQVREGAVARTPLHEEQQRLLEQRAQVLRDKYQSLLRKVESAELAENLESAHQGSKVTVLDKAVPPTSPDTRRLKLTLAAFLASLGLAVGIGVLFEIVDPVLVSAEQIEELFGIPVVGSVPRIS